MRILYVPIADSYYSLVKSVFILSFHNCTVRDLHSDDVSAVLHKRGFSDRFRPMLFAAYEAPNEYVETVRTVRQYVKGRYLHAESFQSW